MSSSITLRQKLKVLHYIQILITLCSQWFCSPIVHLGLVIHRNQFVYMPSQWETTLQCKSRLSLAGPINKMMYMPTRTRSPLIEVMVLHLFDYKAITWTNGDVLQVEPLNVSGVETVHFLLKNILETLVQQNFGHFTGGQYVMVGRSRFITQWWSNFWKNYDFGHTIECNCKALISRPCFIGQIRFWLTPAVIHVVCMVWQCAACLSRFSSFRETQNAKLIGRDEGKWLV